MATSKVIKRYRDTVFRYGEDVFPNETPIHVQYTSIGEEAGHYECVAAKPPNHADWGEWESMPKPPLVTKLHLMLVCGLVRYVKRPLRLRRHLGQVLELLRSFHSPLKRHRWWKGWQKLADHKLWHRILTKQLWLWLKKKRLTKSTREKVVQPSYSKHNDCAPNRIGQAAKRIGQPE